MQHSYAASGIGGTDGALVIDLKNLKSISVNTSTGQAVIGTGNRLGDIVTALNAKGRALPHGTCPYVGIGGHAGDLSPYSIG
jgi:FAD/FMN-containing dehydrogenase